MQNPDVLNVMNSLGIFGKSPLLMQALNAAIQVAPYDVTVLVTGENGVGKDYFYRILHNGSRRRHNKCIAVNCGGLPEGTIDSELFGHVKGAYTGSTSDRKGYFEEADGGTIFLDEVGDLPMSIQAKLLRVLEKGEIIRMGSNDVRKVDVRIVAATNIDLQKAIQEGRFREDLYYRLSTIRIHVPSLRDRSEDIELLFRKFASDTAAKYRMTQGIQLDSEARRVLTAYQWPGNVRQLLHVVEEISIIEMDRLITADVLRRYLPHFVSGVSVGGGSSSSDSSTSFVVGEKAQLYQIIFEMKRQLDEVRARLGMKGNAGVAPHQPKALGPASPLISGDTAPAILPDASATPIVSARPLTPEERLEEIEEIIDAEETEEWRPNTPAGSQGKEATSTARTADVPKTMAEIEKQAIADALRRNNGNRRSVAKELDISERTVHRKIRDYGLD